MSKIDQNASNQEVDRASSENESVENARSLADRRSFLKTIGVTGVGLASASLAAGKLGAFDNSPLAKAVGADSEKVSAAALSDVDILNFALQLEYLEAEFYTVAFTGKTLEESGFDLSGTGTQGETTGGKYVAFPGNTNSSLEETKLRYIAQQLMLDEQEHVVLIRKILGGNAVAKPTINLNALGIGFGHFQDFLELGRAFEDVGASAYGYAAPLITANYILKYAASIALTEAYHASNIRLLITLNNLYVKPVDSVDIVPPLAGYKYFPTNSQGLTITRSPQEVLSILFGNSAAGTSSGGFFPDGLNGVITTV